MTLKISQHFDAGAIEVITCRQADDIHVRIRKDSHAAFAQWFYFRLQGAVGQACRIHFDNAAQCTFAEGWRDYRAVASYDRVNWFRVPTTFDGQVMVIDHCPAHDSVYYAYFEPYSEERHLALVGTAQNSPLVRVTDLGSSVDGRDISLLTVGSAGPAKQKIWIIARQHPGETMAEWFVEGMLRRLIGAGDWAGDSVARALLERAVFYVVPNMNPDGAARGNLRTNAAGANLNREWQAPDPVRSPEVWHVREAIHAAGCDMFFDIHGDEALPYVFVAGNEMLPGFTPTQEAAQRSFIEHFKQASPDFQDQYGYAAGKYQEEALKLASKYMSHRFGCLSLTLEMPFKDNANLPDARVGWSGARSAALGAAMLEAICRQVMAVRD